MKPINYIIIYTLAGLFLFWIAIKYTVSEGLTNGNEYSKDIYSPLYSHTVNLPINDPVSCSNFCGPKSQCLLTREQCTSDIDCYGCKPVKSYDATGKLGPNLGLQYSPLTTGFNNHSADFAQIYDSSKDAQLTVPYQGLDTWTESFNAGLDLYNKKRASADKTNNHLYYEPKYPMNISLTGQFYETTPPAANASIL